MKKKEIKEKFEKLDEQIKSLEKEQEDLYEVTQFILEAIGKNIDEPIYRVTISYDLRNFVLQYAYKNKVKEIATCENIRSVELFAYCDTHFILKNHDNKCFLVDMAKGVITNIPIQLLFSKGMSVTLEGQTFKFCQSTNGIGIRRPDND
jgi:hypothetical protein